jgi:mono/diheme cytochrome c family protein
MVVLGGCRQDMHDQPKIEPYERSSFFEDGKGMRAPVDGTVARGHLNEDVGYATGLVGTEFVAEFPMAVDRAVLDRGQERFNIYCSPCHDRVGTGNGMIVQRGYKQPQTFHSDRVRALPPGYFVNAITNGFATMPSYAHQIPVADRWAIAAYVRALQLSQHASLDDVPASERKNLED